ncbi:hypothetical protein GCM10011512_09690 [Tersicoccus solisilvae]|uniref:Htaa domain-containing protein n=1 Tax=Tersicoccus solisilvae TaxID=1882339 RepID=A0ABQ1NUR9_9MICC|nr:HtaA domain-containing protein [Tersicoccus solisilvae]GGC84902.1 hypothetical protein GCM10011512_09690 [Tersicoccus solisilvae]
MIVAVETEPGTRTTSSSASLIWAFHADFTAYVERLADGRVDVSGGAERTADGRFRFPVGIARGTCLKGTGAVHWTGHHGLLAVTLADPAIEHSGPVVTITDPFSPAERMVLAHLGDPEETETGRRYTRPILTESGADLFMDHYPAGLPLASLEIEDAR